ncbi:hypothetical protein D9615_009992 [Tricholomella constricta]|uniref:cytochrome-b5 reductase n=1 Tax=Tricholomella constricta TaxID=117010 RepID=A0A8H5GTX4_9AGAR|nr:hypothetical protein D9615_009992 [Tricholomella constricta]
MYFAKKSPKRQTTKQPSPTSITAFPTTIGSLSQFATIHPQQYRASRLLHRTIDQGTRTSDTNINSHQSLIIDRVRNTSHNDAFLLPVASCIVVKSSDPDALKNAKDRPIIRPYTPISAPDHKGELTFLIKQYEAGNASRRIFGLKEGDTLTTKGPIVKFPYKGPQRIRPSRAHRWRNRNITGITPLYQVLTHALADKSNKTKFKLLFSNVTEEDILLRANVDALQKKFPDTLDIVYLLDKPQNSWTGPSGFIDADVIKQHVAPASLNEKVKIFICGLPGQVAAIAGKKAGMKQGELGGILKELGYTEEQVFKF